MAVGLFALVKYGKALLLLLPKAKVLTTAGSALVSVAAYALFWGWRFAAIFVVLIFIHEMGHVLQLRREGIKATAPMFIPFLGAVVGMKELPPDAAAEARVGLAGPVLGALGAAALLPVYWATGSELWLNLAYVGFFLNLFNLLPVTPLDGGRAMSALAPWMWFAGLFVLVLLLFVAPNPILLLIGLVAAFDVYRRWKGRNEPGAKAYYAVTRRQRALIGATYLVLLVGLVAGMDLTYVERQL
ncbi:MAG: site-2 protease family protein [Solirubrobacterales bacterium]|nr:site-2 protease family protein [Solirubrobacterales bacterium]